MRVLHVFRTYYPDSDGGIQRAVDHLCAATSTLGVSNHVFALSPRPAPKPQRRGRAIVHQCRRHLELASCSISLGWPSLFQRLARRADIIHYHFPWPFADILHLGLGRHRPALVTYHSDIVRQQRLALLYRPLMRRFLQGMNAIVATSPQYVRTSRVLQSVEPSRLRVIPLGLDEGRYPKVSGHKIAEWRARVGEGFFLFVGVLRYYKGLPVLLEALRDRPHRAVIVGSGPMEEVLKQQAQRLAVSDRITFTSQLPDEDKLALLYLCRALVFPSDQRSEAFGVSLIEAAMMARPMITAEIGTGTSFVNQDGETGFAVTPGDPAALASAMDRLASDPALARRFGNAARVRFEACLTNADYGAAYAGVYQDVIGGSLSQGGGGRR